jgi:hypothetical protein
MAGKEYQISLTRRPNKAKLHARKRFASSYKSTESSDRIADERFYRRTAGRWASEGAAGA